ncbi:phytanoyl-CoA dioxygenase family protein [Pelagibacteraceae bacterium]|nr:phytanoyl-CoA dioxygenase family protein [Pelagibacteraceae bacterium]
MLNSFKKEGYHIEKSIIKKNTHKELFFMFYDLSLSTIKRNGIKLNFKPKKIERINYPKDLKELDKLMIKILKFNNELIGEIYDTVSYSSAFLKLLSDSQIEEITRELLKLKKHNTLYSWTHRIRIDPPKDERRTYGWHQEIFYTIPDTRFLQTWSPIIRSTTINNGTIEVCPGSHMEGVAKQTWSEKQGRVTQILVSEKIVKKYKQKPVPMKVGDLMFFDPHLFHRSGKNKTEDEIRFSLVGMWNDTNHRKFRSPQPIFKSRTISAKDNFNKLMTKL